MDLNKRQWFVTWFFLSLAITDTFRDGSNRGEYRYEKGTNLCHFIRVILLWAPLVLLLHFAVYASAIAALTLVPIFWFGLSGYLGLVFGVAAFIGLIVLASFVCAGISAGFRWVLLRSRKNRQKSDVDEAPEPVVEQRGPSFGEVLWQYAVATKRRICPIINFKNVEVQS